MKLMHRKLLSALLLAACVSPAWADVAPATVPAAAPVVPLLWKVSDADNSVYLLGSFHLLKAEDHPLPKEIDAAFADAETVLFEIPPEAMQSPDTASKFVAAAAYAGGKDLKQVLSPAAYEKLDQLVAAAGGAATMNAFEPWFVSTAITVGAMQQLGFKPEFGLDQALMTRAAKEGKPTGGLETIDAQLAALDGSPMVEQVAGLEEFIDDPAGTMRDLMKLHTQWRAGDVEGLNNDMLEEMIRKAPQTYHLVNVARNNAWLPKIEARLTQSKSDDTLVVVGALHLIGPDGVVEKLRAKGYAVERVCNACSAK